ncbi:hypothetical protein HDU77_006834 [Chytriomyces hyalinus]|nr:hypothetical protein HDU77_006834 [Chytriomyces hyalinus]
MKLASLLTLTLAGLVAADFPAPTNIAYVDWLLTGDAALAGASQECKQSLQSYKSVLTCWNNQAEAQVRSCFCATDSDGLTRAVSNFCAGGGLFPWMQATLNLRAQCEAVPPPVVIETVVEPVRPAPEPSPETQPQPTTAQEPPVVSVLPSTQDDPTLSSSASASAIAAVATSKKPETSVAGTSSATVKATSAATTSSSAAGLSLPAISFIVSACLSLVL